MKRNKKNLRLHDVIREYLKVSSQFVERHWRSKW